MLYLFVFTQFRTQNRFTLLLELLYSGRRGQIGILAFDEDARLRGGHRLAEEIALADVAAKLQ
jgi:hypothetical protein